MDAYIDVEENFATEAADEAGMTLSQTYLTVTIHLPIGLRFQMKISPSYKSCTRI